MIIDKEELYFDDSHDDTDLPHIGVKYRSGRYPYGSGENPFQHDPKGWMNEYKQAILEGKTDKEFAESKHMTTTQLVSVKRYVKNLIRKENVAEAKRLQAEGLNNSEIARRMGTNEGTIRSYLNPLRQYNMERGEKTAEAIKAILEEKGMLDVSKGVEHELGVSRDTLNEALLILNIEGHPIYDVGVGQVTNKGQQTITTVLTPPGTTYGEAYNNIGKIQSVSDYIHMDDGGNVARATQYPESISSKRIQIRYAEDGGKDKDGVIELRRGVDDISLGNSNYAQVRIAVDGTHYLKGMAIYSDNMPPGVDIIFNTNKHSDVSKMDVLKELKKTKDGEIDKDNPFGAVIKPGGQSYYIGKDGKEHLRVINKLKEEGDWDNYKDSISSQMLSKQPIETIERQLNISLAEKQFEYDQIKALTNVTVKKNLLNTFASDCDSSAVHLRAAAFPRQNWEVILPVTSIPEDQVYAPRYNNGEKLALVRFPHGSISEIPIVTVNNNHKEGMSVVGNAIDAIGISSKTAERMSGADFDGDTVLTIPIKNIHIQSKPQLSGLVDFDPKESYATKKTDEVDKHGDYIYRNESGKKVKIMSEDYKQRQMGEVSNLITDMTLKGADSDEIAAAIRHSMVVIDAPKHKLDYQQSEKDNNIKELKNRYQGHWTEDGTWSTGASTLISSAKSPVSVNERQGSPRIDSETGKLWYKESGRTYGLVIDPISGKKVTARQEKDGSYYYKNGNNEKTKVTTEKVVIKEAKQEVPKMMTTDDAFSISSGTVVENLYANYANSLKALANDARKEMLASGNLKMNASAKEEYAPQVRSLQDKVRTAELNQPRERLAQRIANANINAKVEAEGGMSAKDRAKLADIEIKKARAQVGAERTTVDVTEDEWKAIQSGAISEAKLQTIFKYADPTTIRQYATPRQSRELTASEISLIKSYRNSGYTIAQIAERIGRSESAVTKAIKS